jgi:hypothetical protein
MLVHFIGHLKKDAMPKKKDREKREKKRDRMLIFEARTALIC